LNGVGLVTDSASQLTDALAERFGAHVVPVTVTIAGVDHLEGVDLTTDSFYEQLATSPTTPDLATSQPSPAAFVEVFERVLRSGSDQILAVLVGSAYSGAVNSAEVAARNVRSRHPDAVIDVVDSATASFGISCSLWAAAEVLGAGGTLAAARDAAVQRAAVTASVFVLDGLELANRSGRFDQVEIANDEGVAVLASGPDGFESLGQARSAADAVEVMVQRVLAGGVPVVGAIGWAAPTTDPVTAAFHERLAEEPLVTEIVHYRVGPSIAVHTGPNTVGGFFFPV
jgi:DegV family protein with EDD domain